MPTVVPFLRIEQELPSKLILVSTNRRWLILLATLVFTGPLSLIGLLLISDEEIWVVGAFMLVIGLFISILILMFTSFKSQLAIDSTMRTVVLNRHYWLGFGVIGRERERSWSFDDLTDANLTAQGWKKLVEFESNGKKELLLNFGRKAKDAQRTYDLMQSWLKGLAPDSVEATTALNELANEKQNQGALKNAEKLLYYFGGFSLLMGVMGLFTEGMNFSEISIYTMLNIVTGLVYLACGYGVKNRSEIALWVASFVIIAERAYWFFISGALNGGGSWTSWLTWIFVIFIVSSLWKAIQSIRTMDEDPVYKPLA
jgi:hypothetical protein